MKSNAARTLARPEKTAEKAQYALRVSSGFNQGAMVPLARKKNILGRSFRACVPLEDDRVSREHAQIMFVDGRFYLTDMGSTNGTYLNNEAVIEEIEIRPGDVIRIGNSIFRFETLKSKNAEFQTKWKSATYVIPRASFSFQDLSKVKPDRYLFLKRRRRQLKRWALLIQCSIIREAHILRVKAEHGVTHYLFKFQRALSKFLLP